MKNSRAQAIAQFFDANLPMIEKEGTTAFRKAVIEYAANEQNYAVASAAATYNNLVHKAIEKGQVRKERVGVLTVIDAKATGKTSTKSKSAGKSKTTASSEDADQGTESESSAA